MTSERSQIARNVRRDIEVTDDEVDDVGECIQVAISAGAVLDDRDDAIESFGDGVGQIVLDEGEDVVEMRLQRADERAQRGNAASQGGGHPGAQELLCGALVGEAPELSELVLEHPGAMNMAIAMAQAIESAGLTLGARGRVPVQQPAQALDRLALLAGQGAPFILAYRIDGLVGGLGDVDVIDDERGVRAMMLDRLGVGTAHVAAGPADLSALVLAQGLGKEPIDGFAAFSGRDPHHSGALEVVDQGGEFASLAVGDLVGSEAPEAPDAVPIAPGADDAVQQPRERRAGHVQDLGSRLLRHGAAEHADPPFEPVGDARIAGRPGDLLLYTTTRRAFDLPGAEPQQDLDPNEGQILPATPHARTRHDAAPPAALRAATAVLVGLDRQVQLPAVVQELQVSDLHAFQS